MITDIRQILSRKSNDNQTNSEPQLVGNYAKDSLSLCAHWKLSEKQIASWIGMPVYYSNAAINACCAVMQGTTPLTNSEVKAQQVAMCIGLINSLISCADQLPKQEALFVMNAFLEPAENLLKKFE